MEGVFAKYAAGRRTVGIGTGSTMEELSQYLTPDKVYVATSIQAELFLAGLPAEPAMSCSALDVYFDSADYYMSSGEMIKGGGGAMTQEKLFVGLAARTVILVQKSKRRASFEGIYVPVEIIKPSYGYISGHLGRLGLRSSLRKVHGTVPFLTDLGNLIMDVEYNKEFLEGCRQLTGVVEHGYFGKNDRVIVEEI